MKFYFTLEAFVVRLVMCTATAKTFTTTEEVCSMFIICGDLPAKTEVEQPWTIAVADRSTTDVASLTHPNTEVTDRSL